MKRHVAFAAAVLAAAAAHGALADKIVCVPRVEAAPKVDGVLDDDAWDKSEVRSDMVDALGIPMPKSEYPTELRIVQDGKRLYFALKTTFKELPPMANVPYAGKLKPIRGNDGFTFNYCCEIFLDPGRTMSDHYQYLVRADNTCAAHFKMDWTRAKQDIEVASKTSGKTWTCEFSFPASTQLETGMLWGFFFSLNDIGHILNFCYLSGPSNTPQLFAPMLIGSYAEWFADAFAKLQKRIDGYRQTFPKGSTAQQLDYAQDALDDTIKALKAGMKPYEIFARCRANDNALDRVDDQLELVKAGLEVRTMIKDVDFNEWRWRAIDDRTANEMLNIKARGDNIYFDCRGPMMLMPMGRPGFRNGFPFPCGRPTLDAVKGTALHYEPQKTDRLFFQHGPFYGTFHPGNRYRYEFWFKGKGPITVQAELRSIPATGGGETRHHGHKLDRRELPAEWTKVEGVFEFPAPPPDRAWETDNGLVFYVPAGTDFYLDEIKIWELQP